MRKSAVSDHVNSFDVLNRLLGTKVELAVGEVIGVSRELSAMLSDTIKMKIGKLVVGFMAYDSPYKPKTCGLLIRISMECNREPIEAIIDTGSQLNIVSSKVCKSVIRCLIDVTALTSMNDVNGGQGTLTG